MFGATVLFGTGGIFLEVPKDIVLRVAPHQELDARQMIREIRSYPIPRGVRGLRSADGNATIRILETTSVIMLENPQLSSLTTIPQLPAQKGQKVQMPE